MIAARRRQFNLDFTSAGYAALTSALASRCGVPINFRLSETPVFLPAELATRLVDNARQLFGQLLDNPAYRRAAEICDEDVALNRAIGKSQNAMNTALAGASSHR